MKTLHNLLTGTCFSLLAFIPTNLLGQNIDIDGYKYSVRPSGENEVNLLWIPSNVTDAVIPSTIESNGVTYTVVHMSSDATIEKHNLKTLSLPKTLRTIGDMQYAFEECNHLESVTVDEANESFFSKDGALYTKDNVPSLVVLPQCVKGKVELLATEAGAYELDLEDMPNIEGLTLPSDCSPTLKISNLPNLTDLSVSASVNNASITKCPVLANITVASGNASYTASDGVLYHYEKISNSDGTESLVRAIEFFSPTKASYTMPGDVIFAGQYSEMPAPFCVSPNLTSLDVVVGHPRYYSRDNAIYSRDKYDDGEGHTGEILVDVAGGLTSFNLPDDVRAIEEIVSPVDDDRFEDRTVPVLSYCQKLTTITATEGNPYFFASDGILYKNPSIMDLEEGIAVEAVPSARTGKVTVPDGVKRVTNMAFYGSSIDAISLPDGIVAGYAAFANSKQLSEVTFRGEGQAESTAFLGTPFLENHEPGVLYAGHTAYGMAGNLKEIVIKEGTKTIGKEAFAEFDRELLLEKVTLPKGLENIESYAFVGCINMKSINLPASLKYVASNAFDFCTSLSELTLEEGISFMPDIYGDLPITEIYVPASVKDWFIELYPQNMTSIVVSPDNPYYTSKDGILYSKDMTTVFVVPNAKTTLRIPEGVTRIGAREVEEDMSVAKTRNTTDCIPPTPMFGEDIETLYLPASVREYAYGVFRDCDKLKAVYNYAAEPTSFDEYFAVFPYDLSDVVLYVPTGCAEAYRQANIWKNFGAIEEFDATGIETVPVQGEVKEVARYSLDGRLLSAPQPGINLIKMSDGTVRKVIVR